MITEDYVSFETAKLLKEKGFDEPTTKSYYTEGLENPMIFSHDLLPRIQTDEFLCPTLQMAMKWLREVHKECVVVQPIVTDDDGSAGCLWRFSISRLLELQYESESIYELYETACEAAIKYCLTNLI